MLGIVLGAVDRSSERRADDSPETQPTTTYTHKTQSHALLGERAKREQAREAARQSRVEARRGRLRGAWELIQQRKLRVGEPYYGGDAGGGEARRQVEALPTVDPVGCFGFFGVCGGVMVVVADGRAIENHHPALNACVLAHAHTHTYTHIHMQATGRAVWPLLLLYPQHLVSDFVERAGAFVWELVGHAFM